MNFVRIIIGLLVTIGAYIQVSGQIASAFSNDSKIVLDGLLNIWASFGMLLICPYLTIYVIKDEFTLRLPIGDANRVLVILGLVVAPLLAIGLYNQSHANVANYVECKSERKLSSRYSSRTYAITEDLCQTLKSQND